MKKRMIHRVVVALMLVLIGSIAFGMGHTDARTTLSVEDFDGRRIGVLTGTMNGPIAEASYPNAQIEYFNSLADMLTALKAGKLDALVTDEPIIRYMMIDNPGLTIVDGSLMESNLAAVFAKTDEGQALCDEYSAFIEGLWEDGTIEQIDDKWFGADDAKRTVSIDYESLPDTAGTLRMAVDLSLPPFTYMKDNRIEGYDVDIAARFCQEYGYGLEIVPMSFDGILPSVQSGKCDFAQSCITISEERAQSVLFSTPCYRGGIRVAVWEDEEAYTTGTASEYATLSDFGGKRIGVVTGAIQGAAVEREIPTAEPAYYNSVPDMLTALRADKIDAFAATDQIVRFLMLENEDLTYLDEPLTEPMNTGVIFAKTETGTALREEFNEWLAEVRDAGVLDEIEETWLGEDESRRTVIDIANLSGENGTLTLATDASMIPSSYIKDNTNVGMDIDVVLRFCDARGYALKIVDMSFSGIIDAVVTGKCDFAAGAIGYTEERAQSVDFSDPLFVGYSVIAYLKTAGEQGTEDTAKLTFWDGIRDSFNKTFLREERWRLFLSGIGTTLLITLLSVVFGTVLGFSVFMLCRGGSVIANGITRFCTGFVQGTPMVVLLMILYYIIFVSVPIGGVAVAVIGFTLTFGASVYGLLKIGVGTIDRGQYEAAYALGHSDRHTFFKIILPQALPHVLPAYRGEIVSLMKATAIVGYIAVQDLTKMGDIVRSRTYEAFFPLIAVTVIYFVLEGLFGLAVSRIRIGINPKRRSRERILRGVNTYDQD